MSDYLWDKEGEPDAEVARLEALLGAYAHEPRPLNLPAAPPEPRPRRLLSFVPRLFAPAALAAAAALLVASVLVASAFLRARQEERPAPVAEWGMLEPPPGAFEVMKDEAPSSKATVKDGQTAAESLPRVPRRRKEVQVAAAPRRWRKAPTAEPSAGEGLTLEKMSTPGGASSLVESARLLTKEQLVYALRLTGAKLKDVRERAQGTGKVDSRQ